MPPFQFRRRFHDLDLGFDVHSHGPDGTPAGDLRALTLVPARRAREERQERLAERIEGLGEDGLAYQAVVATLWGAVRDAITTHQETLQQKIYVLRHRQKQRLRARLIRDLRLLEALGGFEDALWEPARHLCQELERRGEGPVSWGEPVLWSHLARTGQRGNPQDKIVGGLDQALEHLGVKDRVDREELMELIGLRKEDDEGRRRRRARRGRTP